MPARSLTFRPTPAAGLGLSGLGAALFAWLHAPLAVPFHYGSICSHAIDQPHCLGCYVAAAMVAAGFGVAMGVAARG